jgi:exopolyphosphatase/guanosine-5'-triphosphate,3'-diphosphate pyrophosphatase
MGERLFSADGYNHAVTAITAQLTAFDHRHGILPRLSDNAVQMMGTSGTVTTLGALHLRLDRYDRSLVDGLDLAFADIAAVLGLVALSKADHLALTSFVEEVRDIKN